jgi:outer membrane protein assembly factor BamB
MIGRMRRLLVAVAVLVLLAGAATAYYVSKHRFGGNVRGSSTEFNTTSTVAPPKAGPGLVSPMFGGEPEHLHVGVGHVRPPYKLDWVSGGTSLIEFPPAVAYGYLYYATLRGNFIAASTRNGQRLWNVSIGRCEAASPAVSSLYGGTAFESWLNRKPCGRGAANTGDGEVVAVSAGRPHKIRWRKHLAATETSPTIVGNRIFVGDAQGEVYALDMTTGKTLWHYKAGGAVKGAIAYDHGDVFFGSYDGDLYALHAATGKPAWPPASSANPSFGHKGDFYSTPAVAYSRIYLGSTDGFVYSFGEKSGKVRWRQATGGYVYGSPAVWDGRVFVGSYSHLFYALDAATGDVLWRFRANGPISGSATVVDGIVYFATLQHRTYGLDARTGKKVWSWPDGSFTPVVTDGSKLYVVGYSKIYALSPRHRFHGRHHG